MAAKLLTAQFNEIKKTFHCISYKFRKHLQQVKLWDYIVNQFTLGCKHNSLEGK